MEIAGAAEDAPLEALQEAEDEVAVQAAVDEEPEDEAAPREKPAVPGAHLEVDIVPEGVDPLGREQAYEDPYAIEEEEPRQSRPRARRSPRRSSRSRSPPPRSTSPRARATARPASARRRSRG